MNIKKRYISHGTNFGHNIVPNIKNKSRNQNMQLKNNIKGNLADTKKINETGKIK